MRTMAKDHQLLAAKLEEADPAVYHILQKVGPRAVVLGRQLEVSPSEGL